MKKSKLTKKLTLIKKFKFPRRAGALSAVMLIVVGAMIVYLTRATTGDSPILVTESVSASAPNKLTYIVAVTNITEQQIRNIRLNIQVPDFRTNIFNNLGTSTYVGSTDFDGNSTPVRPAESPTTSMGSNTKCIAATSYTDAGWYSGANSTTGCPHYAWKMHTLSAGETRTFTYTLDMRIPSLPGVVIQGATDLAIRHYSQVYFTGTFTSRLSESGMPFNKNITRSEYSYAICTWSPNPGYVCVPRGF